MIHSLLTGAVAVNEPDAAVVRSARISSSGWVTMRVAKPPVA